MGDDVEGRSFIRDDIKLEEEEGFVKFECSTFVETNLKSDIDVRDEVQPMVGHDFSLDVITDLKPSLKQEDGADEFITGDLDQSDDDDDEEKEEDDDQKEEEDDDQKEEEEDDQKEEDDDDVNSPPPKRSRLVVNSPLERKNYNCRRCPFTSEHEARFKNHLKLHKKGSKSIICSECGCHVHPCCMTVHLKSCHATTQEATANGTKRVMEQDTSNPLFSTHYTGDSKWPILKCRRCPYQNKKRRLVETHAEVHKEGVNAVSCFNCGIYMLSHRLFGHKRTCSWKGGSDSPTPVAVPVVVNCKISR